MFVRKTKLPSEIEVQYIRVSKLLKPEVKAKTHRIATSLVPHAIRLNFSSLHKLLISKTREAFPKTSQAEMQILLFQTMCEILEALIKQVKDQTQTMRELVKAAVALVREVAQRQDAAVRSIAGV